MTKNTRIRSSTTRKEIGRKRITRKKTKGSPLPGAAISTLFLVLELWFFVRLMRLGMLPGKYMALIGAALVIAGVLVWFLCRNSAKLIRFSVGTLLALIIAGGLTYGTGLVDKLYSTVQELIVETTEAKQVQLAVFVRQDDPAQALDALESDAFGIERSNNRDETDKTLNEIATELETHLLIKEYDGFIPALRGLLEGEVRAAVLEADVLEMAAEMLEDRGDLHTLLRQISAYHVEKETVSTHHASSTVPRTSGRYVIIGTTAKESEATTPAETEPEQDENELPDGPVWAPAIESTDESRIFTIYIQGIDSRRGLVSKSLSDVNILAVVNMNSKQVLLISTPRDYYVYFANTGQRDKLTHNGWGGVSALMETLRMLYGVKSNYYFRMDFKGFVRIIDAMGGVDVYVDRAFSAQGFSFSKGTQHMSGTQALAFARERYAFGGGDAIRGTHQMEVIKAVLYKAMSSNLSTLLGSLGGAFETSMPYDTISSAAASLLSGGWNVVSYNVGGRGSSEYSPAIGGNAYVMWPDQSTVNYARSLIRRLYNGERVSP